ncbi:MAG: hypothetical protein ABI416_06485, partial [Ginsengibacter sp.]
MKIICTPVATVKNSRTKPIDDNWAEIISEIELTKDMPAEVFNGIADFSHLEIIYYFNQVKND